MATAYDILGVIFGLISLLVFVGHARRFIDTRLRPPAQRPRRIRWGSRRVDELDKHADVLWIEAERWRRIRLTRRFLPSNRVDLVRACNHLQRGDRRRVRGSLTVTPNEGLEAVSPNSSDNGSLHI
ncbi:hypothetical protein VTO73DRAFT_2094 [Trametes versicolor]